MCNHLYRPEGVIKAEIIRALSVISTNHNPLAMSSEQYHSALFGSYKKSAIRVKGYIISLVN